MCTQSELIMQKQLEDLGKGFSNALILIIHFG